MDQVLRVLIIEDNASDATLVLHFLQKGGYQIIHERVETAVDMRKMLDERDWDILLCDHNLPQFNAPKALELLHEYELDIPFIVVSGAIGEELAVDLMKAGAHDVVMKTNLKRLPAVVDRELAEAKMRKKQKRGELLQRILFNIANAVITTSDLPTLIKLIRDQLGTVIDTTNFYIAIYNEAADTFSLPFMADQKAAIEAFPAGKTLSSYVLRSKQPLLAKREDLDKLEENGLIKTLGEKAKVWLGVPLISNTKAIGVLAVQNYEDENAYTVDDLEIIMFASDQIILAIDRKKAEDDLKSSLFKAEESDRLKTSFLANMSHEIRTPMHSISNCSELLQDEDVSREEALEYLAIINDSCQDLLDVFQQIVDIAKIDSKQMEISTIQFDLNAMLLELKKHYESKIVNRGKSNLVLSLKTENHLGVTMIDSDREKLKQVLKSLLDNAVKFTDSGAIIFGYESKEDDWHFFVQDSGIGIPTNMHKLVFEKFRQAEENYSRTYGGTGLGLPISKGLINLLGGEIDFESESGKGTKFYFTIPKIR